MTPLQRLMEDCRRKQQQIPGQLEWPQCPHCGGYMDKGENGEAVGPDCPVCGAPNEG